MSKPTVIVYGPMGCGKTRNGQRLLRALGLNRLIDDGLDHEPNRRIPPCGALVLTNREDLSAPAECIRMTFRDAMRRARAN